MIPGTKIPAQGSSPKVEALRAIVTEVLKARAIELAPSAVSAEATKTAIDSLSTIGDELETGLDQAGRTGRLVKKRFAAVDRLSDANDDLQLTLDAVAEARATNTFNAEDLDEQLLDLREHLISLALMVARGPSREGEGLAWLLTAAMLDSKP